MNDWIEVSGGRFCRRIGVARYCVAPIASGGFLVQMDDVEIAGPDVLGAPAGFKTAEAARAYAEQHAGAPQPIVADGWRLVRTDVDGVQDLGPVHVGERLTDFRGDAWIAVGGMAPRREGSTGRIDVAPPDAPGRPAACQFYPSVMRTRWLRT